MLPDGLFVEADGDYIFVDGRLGFVGGPPLTSSAGGGRGETCMDPLLEVPDIIDTYDGCFDFGRQHIA